MKTGWAALAVLLIAAPGAAQRNGSQNADPAVIVGKAARNYKALTSLTANVRLRIEDKILDNEDHRGTIAMLGPTKFRLLFTSPIREFYLLDGKDEYTYFPSFVKGQVGRRAITSTPSDGMHYLSLFLDSPLERYNLTYLRSEAVGKQNFDVVEMVAKSRDWPFRSAIVSFDREDGLPRKFDIDYVQVHKIFEMNAVQLNRALPDSIFKFTLPPGAHIVPQ